LNTAKLSIVTQGSVTPDQMYLFGYQHFYYLSSSNVAFTSQKTVNLINYHYTSNLILFFLLVTTLPALHLLYTLKYMRNCYIFKQIIIN